MEKVFKFLSMLVLVAGALSLIRVADLQTRGAASEDTVVWVYKDYYYKRGGRVVVVYHYIDLKKDKKLDIDAVAFDSIRPPESVMVQRTWLYGYPKRVKFNRKGYLLETDVSYPYIYVICFFNIALALMVMVKRDLSLGAVIFAVLGNLIYWAISTS